MTFTTNFKPSRTARKKAKVESRLEREAKERSEKAAVRRRDKKCRFPLCGCKQLGLRLEVSHDFHKGTNGNSTKEAVSIASLMIYLCEHRHQHGTISRHKRTLETRYLTPDHDDGPVAWMVDIEALPPELLRGIPPVQTRWLEVARERDINQLEPLEPWQKRILETLGEMDL